ncbi:MAG TPA: hypothetical protein VKB50_13915 [Vicinamibacterales bacterium]|nr:hypothetical protein [Vicinamibacterales bacterium]
MDATSNATSTAVGDCASLDAAPIAMAPVKSSACGMNVRIGITLSL